MSTILATLKTHIVLKFDLHQKVRIVVPDLVGIIVGFEIDTGVLYIVEYWWNGEVRTVKLWEQELETYTESKSIGLV